MGGRGGNDNAGPKEGSLGGIGVLLTGNNSVTNIGRIYGGNYGNAGSDGDTIIVAPAIVAGGDGNKIVNAGGSTQERVLRYRYQVLIIILKYRMAP